MTDRSKIQEFPDINNKLAAPTKKSLFERQKAEAEAKRRREEAETAAVLKDFVKSFDDEDAPLPSSSGSGSRERASGGGGFPGAGRAGLGGSGPRRQFAGPPLSGPPGRGGPSGPRGGFGSSGVGSLGPPPGSLSRKRAHDGAYTGQSDSNEGLFAFDEDSPPGAFDTRTAFAHSDDEDDDKNGSKAERAAPKPTLHLSSLPPGTSPAVIKALLQPCLTVDAVRILPPSGPGSLERKSLSSIVTLATDSSAADVDSAVTTLQNRYLGWGYNLSLSRHLSSAALNSSAPIQAGASALSSLPFGAKPLQPASNTGGGPMHRAPPPSSIHRGGFAPPTSYHSSSARPSAPVVHVSVTPPSDLRQLKLIHKTLEALLLHGPEFEALLMSRSEVQRAEKWAWIWDPRSPGGVWYRWRLWQILSHSSSSAKTRKAGRGATKGLSEFVFDTGAAWTAPREGLRYEYVTRMEEFVSDSEYDSDEEDEEEGAGEEGRRRREGQHSTGGPPAGLDATGFGSGNAEERVYLNPLKKAKLTHLLARLPASNARLRKGDVARVTAFAIEHAGEGADEVVDLIVRNVETPFAFTGANPERSRVGEDEEADDKEKEREDTSPAMLVALYVVSDILSSSSTSGVRHAWRYRQLFETALKQRQVFDFLGRLERTQKWGRLRAEKWKRSVGAILALWEGWCVFPQAAQEHFVAVFQDPPPTARELEGRKTADAAAVGAGDGGAVRSKWKTVDVDATDKAGSGADAPGSEADVDMDVDGEPMGSDADFDIDGVPMDAFDGEPMEVEGAAVDAGERGSVEAAVDRVARGEQRDNTSSPPRAGLAEAGGSSAVEAEHSQSPAARGRRPRPKAEDMFADSDED